MIDEGEDYGAPKKVVGQVSKSLVDRYQRLERQKASAREWLGDLGKEEQGLWDKVFDELDLDSSNDYALDTETGEVKEQTTFKGDG